MLEDGFQLRDRIYVPEHARGWCGNCGAEVSKAEQWTKNWEESSPWSTTWYMMEAWFLEPCGCLVDPASSDHPAMTLYLQTIPGCRELVP